jgi:FeS assembly SUF system protein
MAEKSPPCLRVSVWDRIPHIPKRAMTPEEKKHLEERVIDMLKSVYDPEIPVDIYELGLIYEVNISEDAHVGIKMTLTSPACPVAESLPNEVEQKVASVTGVSGAKVEITFEPPWDRTMMSEAAQLELGFM